MLKRYAIISWVLIGCGTIFIVQDKSWVNIVGIIYWSIGILLQYGIGLKAIGNLLIKAEYPEFAYNEEELNLFNFLKLQEEKQEIRKKENKFTEIALVSRAAVVFTVVAIGVATKLVTEDINLNSFEVSLKDKLIFKIKEENKEKQKD